MRQRKKKIITNKRNKLNKKAVVELLTSAASFASAGHGVFALLILWWRTFFFCTREPVKQSKKKKTVNYDYICVAWRISIAYLNAFSELIRKRKRCTAEETASTCNFKNYFMVKTVKCNCATVTNGFNILQVIIMVHLTIVSAIAMQRWYEQTTTMNSILSFRSFYVLSPLCVKFRIWIVDAVHSLCIHF